MIAKQASSLNEKHDLEHENHTNTINCFNSPFNLNLITPNSTKTQMKAK